MTSRPRGRSDYEQIASLLAHAAGLRTPDAGDPSHNIIKRLIRAAGADSAATYRAQLERDPAAAAEASAELTVGETYFFRDTGQFNLIRHEILPEIAARKSAGETIRIWSAGCATGEEAYSLAIVARELGLADRVRIIATDLAAGRLQTARAGRYGRWSFRGVAPSRVEQHFRAVGRQFELDAALRSLVEFRCLNLADDGYSRAGIDAGSMDLVLCRNVLIYMDAPTVAHVARGLVGAVAPAGWLLLGAADPAIAAHTPCDVLTTDAGLAYRPPRTVERRRASAKPHALPAPVIDPVLPPSAPVRDARSRVKRVRSAPRSAAIQSKQALAEEVRRLANEGRLADAERACAVALERHPQEAELLCLQSVLLDSSGQHTAAVRAARQALYLEPRFVMAHLALGAALARLCDAAGARRSFENAERLLAPLPPEQIVPASGDVAAGRLLELARMQLRVRAEPK